MMSIRLVMKLSPAKVVLRVRDYGFCGAPSISAAETLALSEEQYKLGAISYLSLLDAQRSYQQAHIALVQAQAARYADTAALFQALGGGWWNRADGVPAATPVSEAPSISAAGAPQNP